MINQILQGDVIEILKKLLAESMHCIITSPPYFGLRDYNLPPTNWPEVSYAPMPGLPALTIPAMSCCLGLEDSIEAYVGHMILVFRELWRVLRGDGVAWLNLGDSYSNVGKWGGTTGGKHANGLHGNSGIGRAKKDYGDLKPKNLIGIPWRVAFALQADGWYLRSDVIWAKKNPMPESVTDRPAKAHEYLFLLAKSERYWYDQEAVREKGSGKKPGNKVYKYNGVAGHETKQGILAQSNIPQVSRNKRTVWHLSSQPLKGAHFAVMPEALVEPCILAGCPSRVCVECGQPWVRVVEKVGKSMTVSERHGRTGHNGQPPQISGNYWKGPTTKGTNQFRPQCQCSAPHRPGVVLDPFFGSGTVAVVAKKLKRDWLGIELNPEYIELAHDRIGQTQPALFAVEGAC